jgi:murein DD-endopeptidase MepM/ murein hydrolase activator NlpD
MIRVILILFTSIVFVNATSPKELFSKIEESKKTLKSTSKEQTITNKQLQKIAAKIEKTNKEIAIYDKKLEELDKYLNLEQKKYLESKSEISGINNMVKALDKDIEKRKREFAKKLSTQLGSIVAQNQTSQKSERSVVLSEVYSKYKDYNQQELLKLSKNIEQKNALRKNLLARKEEISKGIEDIKLKKKIYKKQKIEKEKLLKKLAQEQKQYSKKLRDIFKKQTVIRLTLAKLNILKEDAAAEAKKRELALRKRIKELKNIKFSSSNRTNVKLSNIKKYNDAYVAKNIYKYRGAKTISPIKSPKLIKRFGTFIDPIYKIKSHSDSVTMVSKSGDRRVYNVLNGEVVYVGRSAMLGKLIIVKHSNGLHTIYADLDKFSPFIKKGSKVKKGTVLGKIKRKLIFQATKDGALINPARLINL